MTIELTITYDDGTKRGLQHEFPDPCPQGHVEIVLRGLVKSALASLYFDGKFTEASYPTTAQ